MKNFKDGGMVAMEPAAVNNQLFIRKIEMEVVKC
jgi:hypothetical protein